MKIPAFLVIGILALLCSCGGGGSSTGGGSSNPIVNPPPQSNPTPSISTLSPNTASAGSAAFTLTVNGSNFISSSAVQWNGASRQTTFVSATQLHAVISAGDIASAGTVQVTISNPTPGGGTSNSATFTISSPANPSPVISSIRPDVVLAGNPGFTLAIYGRNFNAQSVVRWNGADRPTTFVTPTKLQASIPATDVKIKGTAQVTVFTPISGGTSNGVTLTSTLYGGPITLSSTNVAVPWTDAGPLAAGKFNLDRNADIAVTDSFPQTVHIGLGDGTGNFNFSLMNLQAKNVFAADFNGDGIMDLAFTTLPLNVSLDEVFVFLGDGKGNFKESWHYGYPLTSCRAQGLGRLAAIISADVNGDGRPDLMVGHTGFSVFLNNGDGTFAIPLEFGCTPGANSESTGIAAADFNNDGATDLAIVDTIQNTLVVWVNDGSGHFSPLPPLRNGGLTWGGSIASADFDLDGNADIALKANPSIVFIFYGHGDGTFIGAGIRLQTMDPTGFRESVLSTADVNGDSIPDITVSGPSDQNQFPGTDTSVEVYLSIGPSQFFNFTGGSAFFGGAGGIGVFDVNGDGRPDVILAGSGTLWELLSR